MSMAWRAHQQINPVMKVEFWVTGKNNEAYLDEGSGIYLKRLSRYLPFEMEVLPDIRQAKNLKPLQLKEKESDQVLTRLKNEDFLVLLDEKGRQFTSESFARWLEVQLQGSSRRLIFVVGGAYGFSQALYDRANVLLSLSGMTFSHQMVRLFFLEQLYRAMTILKNEPYHNA